MIGLEDTWGHKSVFPDDFHHSVSLGLTLCIYIYYIYICNYTYIYIYIHIHTTLAQPVWVSTEPAADRSKNITLHQTRPPLSTQCRATPCHLALHTIPIPIPNIHKIHIIHSTEMYNNISLHHMEWLCTILSWNGTSQKVKSVFLVFLAALFLAKIGIVDLRRQYRCGQNRGQLRFVAA